MKKLPATAIAMSLAAGLAMSAQAAQTGQWHHRDTTSTTAPTTTTTAAKPAATKASDKHHFQFHSAINSLERTKADLQAAGHDYGGHREKALEAINTALSEINAAYAFDNRDADKGASHH